MHHIQISIYAGIYTPRSTTVSTLRHTFHRTNHRWSGIPWYKIPSPGQLRNCEVSISWFIKRTRFIKDFFKKKNMENPYDQIPLLGSTNKWYDDQSSYWFSDVQCCEVIHATDSMQPRARRFAGKLCFEIQKVIVETYPFSHNHVSGNCP